MDARPHSFMLNGNLYVYLDEEHIARVTDLIQFAREHETEFWRWHKQWGEQRFQTVAQQ